MTRLAVRLEACRLAIAVVSPGLTCDQRIAELSTLVVFFESILCDAQDDTPPEPLDYPRIGAAA